MSEDHNFPEIIMGPKNDPGLDPFLPITNAIGQLLTEATAADDQRLRAACLYLSLDVTMRRKQFGYLHSWEYPDVGK